MVQQKQELQPDKVQSQQIGRKPRFRLHLAVVISVFILFIVIFLTVIIVLSSLGKDLSLIFISVIVPVLGLVISLIQLVQSLAAHRAESLKNSLHATPTRQMVSVAQTIPSNTTEIPGTTKTQTIQSSEELDKETSLTEAKHQFLHRVDWGEAPVGGSFYGRDEERAELKQWIIKENCKLVAVLGIGGIGKSTLAAKLVKQNVDEFDYIFWRELKNAPPVTSILKNCIQFISNQQRIDLPDDMDDQITVLFQYLRDYRCLLILDNIETILQRGKSAGQYRGGYEGYGRLFQLMGESHHKSCLLLTSREKLNEVAHLEGKESDVRSLQLSGLGVLEGREVLKNKGLLGKDEAYKDLIDLYSGNPLALKLVSEPIQELFKGDITRFLQEEKAVVGNVYALLDHQFHRLSEREQEIMYWLAIDREAVSLDDLQSDIVHSITKQELFEALNSLRRRSMIEASGIGLVTLQPVIMEFVTDNFIKQISEEVTTEACRFLESHALIKAQTKDYIRDSQIRVVLKPIILGLLAAFGKEGIEDKLRRLISSLREMFPQGLGYVVGNILNMLVQLQCDLRGYDFSHLRIRQAYLREVTLADVNFTHASFEKSIFAEDFGSVLSGAFSPDGRLLAVGTGNGNIRIWQTNNATPLGNFLGHTDWVWSVTFSPDGKLLASGCSDQTIRLWEMSTGQCLTVLRGHSNRVYSVMFSPDGRLLASGSSDQTMRLWEVSTGQCLAVLQGHSNWIYSVAFSSDGRLLASGSEDQTVRLWEVSTGQCVNVLSGHKDKVWTVVFSPDGRLLASGSEDQTVRLWEVSTGQCVNVLRGHGSWIHAISFSPNGKVIASGSEDQTVRLWEVSTGQCFNTLLGHKGRVRIVVFSSDERLLASGGRDQTVRLWEADTGRCLNVLQGHDDRIRSVAFNLSGSVIASGSEDQTVRLWRASTGQCLNTLLGHANWVYSVAFSPDGRLLASGSEDQTVRLWEVSTGRCLNTLWESRSRVRSVAFSPDGRLLASGNEDHTVSLWEVSTGRYLTSLSGHTDKVWTVAFSPDGRLLASGSEDQVVQLWEVSTGSCINTLRGHLHRIWAVAFSPDGRLLASGGYDQMVRLWDIDTGRCINALQGHNRQIYSVTFSPDGSMVASGSHDQTVRLWKLSTGQCLNTLRGHTDRISAVAFSPDGRVIISGGYDGTICIRDVRTGRRLRTLRSLRLYERMNISGVKGLTEAQKAALKGLGAIEYGNRS
jgi:WD40 repeat protein